MIDPTPEPRLKAYDRCDRCGAQAYVRLRQLLDGSPLGPELLLCAHHAREHLPALTDRFAIVDDDRARLAPTP